MHRTCLRALQSISFAQVHSMWQPQSLNEANPNLPSSTMFPPDTNWNQFPSPVDASTVFQMFKSTYETIAAPMSTNSLSVPNLVVPPTDDLLQKHLCATSLLQQAVTILSKKMELETVINEPNQSKSFLYFDQSHFSTNS